MNVSMGQLVNDAKELVMRLKEREKNVDQVVVQSNALAKKVDAIQQLESELMNINEKANHRSKVAVLSSIQKENKVIKLLQQENQDLKESLEEHQSVLEIIMSKYRQQMLQLIRLKKQQEFSENYFQSAIFKSLQEKTDQIAEMTEVMKQAIELDEKSVNENEERLQSLLVENKGLKELLRIKSKFGLHDQQNFVNKEVQTIENPLTEQTTLKKEVLAPIIPDMSEERSDEMRSTNEIKLELVEQTIIDSKPEPDYQSQVESIKEPVENGEDNGEEQIEIQQKNISDVNEKTVEQQKSLKQDEQLSQDQQEIFQDEIIAQSKENDEKLTKNIENQTLEEKNSEIEDLTETPDETEICKNDQKFSPEQPEKSENDEENLLDKQNNQSNSETNILTESDNPNKITENME